MSEDNIGGEEGIIEERRKKLEGTTDDPTGEFKYKTTITTIDPAISATEPIKKEIEALT